ATHLTVGRLSAGHRYYFEVEARNAAGLSVSSALVSAVPYTTPSVPRSLQARAGHKSLALTWVAPSSSGSTTITGYQVQYAACRIGAAHCNAVTRSTSRPKLMLRGLTADRQYYARVRAVNRAGVGSYTAQLGTRTK
ncbi:MAG TPA: fibronectin type III domain-containing protein, partial [Jatrophihabitantaceae bacterium]|nr:fibronectin type III domain-containing protein [Jatrophihabitantaceae bacterium]